MAGALVRYRVLALVVGTLLVLLVIGMVLKYSPIDEPALAGVVAPVHGFLYMVYLLVAYDLWRRTGWPLSRMVMIVLGGIVPLMTFFVERGIVRDARALRKAEAVANV
ncbi:DUF3817 domain-containing protein [Actinomadura spongiicola]|uniref:DUF3817 domain-containing protein n=1 Tax=Actinomadura spongiicola TaxID=2303421 RepID=A0A372GBM5_9ACTN|nr:DUF3817 domain-containing protein [Actinomadura spongiicola]RFS82747.1 DUF3817 domain-containing protein [Actinomadura spongiicola]